ncbi:MAG: DUF6384 family protein [Rubripirellula sp.]
MANQSQAQAPNRSTGSARRTSSLLPEESLSLQETLRVMDVAREMRDQRETAEEMFRRDDLRTQLRDKLVRTARMSGDNVTEEEIELAIEQFFESVHSYQDPQPGMKSLLAHCWVWRGRLALAAAALTTVLGGLWFMFS